MKSIKNKLLNNIILINSLILIGIFVFKIGFEDFYIKNTSKVLNDFGKSVEDLIYEGNEEDLSDYIFKYGQSKNISVDIYDDNDELVFNNKKNINDNKNNNKNNKKQMMKSTRCHITNDYKINKDLYSYVILDKSEGVEFLSTIIKTKNDYSIVCKTPITAIKNTVDIAFKFLIMIFIPIIIISVFMAIYLSNKFTKPIIKLTNISDKISNLNFSEKSSIHTDDEIEVLGNSINVLSEKIEGNLKDLKFKNEELQNMIDNKIKQEKIRREFVSSVSHELKTPLTVINGYAHGLKNNVITNEEDKNYYVDVICEESEKMSMMVNDLLDLYKLESEIFKLKKSKVDINDLIKSVVKKHEFILKEKDILIDINNKDLLDEGNYVSVDKIRIEQVLNNLLDNAITHTSYKKEIQINIKSVDDYVYVGIYNNGDLIEKENLEKIWYSFVRVDKARTSSYNKLGLGLAIVREIINLHNGEYGVLNKESGVEFFIMLKNI